LGIARACGNLDVAANVEVIHIEVGIVILAVTGQDRQVGDDLQELDV